jgi:hypothetical protein
MVPPNPDESEPAGGTAGSWLSARNQRREASHPPAIWKRVALPEKVSVKYLAEISGDTLGEFLEEMRKFRILIDANRAVDFADAAKILRAYGIAADRGA